MKNNPENIPEFIFDLLETHAFAWLSSEQQKEILPFFTAEEYDELHQTIAGIRGVQTIADSGRSRKSELMAAFDRQHPEQSRRGLRLGRSVPLWQVAASLLLLCVGWMLSTFFGQKSTLPDTTIAKSDTVYLIKELEGKTVHVYDTVLLPSAPAATQTIPKKARPQAAITASAPKMGTPASDNLNVLSIRDMKRMPNAQRRNSMKDDSLLRKFSFVTL